MRLKTSINPNRPTTVPQRHYHLKIVCQIYINEVNGPMISFGNFGTGKFLYEWRSHEYRNLKFSMNHERYIANPPMNGLAGVVKNNFSKSGEAASGEIVFYHNC